MILVQMQLHMLPISYGFDVRSWHFVACVTQSMQLFMEFYGKCSYKSISEFSSTEFIQNYSLPAYIIEMDPMTFNLLTIVI